jgi:predicted dehydrogenase
VIGIGNCARHGPIRVINLLPEYKLSMLYSQRREAAKEGAEQYGVGRVADSVVVLTTAPQHAASIRSVIEAGKDVYSEWPLTVSTKLSDELMRLAQARGVRTFTGLQRRLAPFNRFVGQLLQAGYVGRLRSARIHVSMNYFQPRLPKALAWTAPPENFSSMVARSAMRSACIA